ncbi:general substrate transporter [Neoconidiobolus thromboides FSU 785]|nr:general substrate transporter [Neoconidiobolus thromboides FSU 785]
MKTKPSNHLEDLPSSLNAKLNSKLVLNSLIVSLGGINAGYSIGISNLMISIISDCDKTLNCIYVGDDLMWGFIIGVLALGAIVGAVLSSQLIFKFGFKLLFYIQVLFFVLGELILVFSYNNAMLVISRFILGVSCGLITVALPTYLVQIATIKYRNIISSLTAISLSIGLFLSNLFPIIVDSYLYWRYLLGIPLVISIFQLLFIPFLIPSPRNVLLINNTNISKAESYLKELRKGYSVDEELEEIIQSINNQKQQVNELTLSNNKSLLIYKLKSIFKNKSLLKKCLLAFLLVSFQELCGTSAILYYSSIILENYLPKSIIIYGNMFITLVSLLASILCSIVLDFTGKRKMLLFGIVIQILSWLCLILGFHFNNGLSQLIAMILYIFTFSFTLLPISYILLPELVPTNYLNIISSSSLVMSWLLNFIIGFLFPMIYNLIQGYSFIVFLILNLILFIICFFFVPETKDLSLERIQSY